jgi:hypothetical protein
VSGPDGVRIKVICGRFCGLSGPVTGITTDPEYLDITLPPGVRYLHPVQPGYVAIAYIIGGSAGFASAEAKEWGNTTLVTFADDGDEVGMVAGQEGARLLFFSGRPLREPIAWQGPIVMNTAAELQEAFQEYRNGTFLRHHRHG